MGRPLPDLDCALQDRVHTVEQIRSIAHEVFGARATVRGVTLETLKRGLVRYNVDLEGERLPWLVIGKVYRHLPEGQHGFDVMRRLGELGFSNQPAAEVRIPQAYRYLPDLRLLLMEHAPGVVLKKLVRRKLAGREQMRLFAAALTKLHCSPLVSGEPLGVDHHLAVRCAGLHGAMAEAFPDVADRVRWIVKRATELESRGEAPATLVHGDFHLGQLHVHDRQIWMLDLDTLHIGDPAYDVAMVFVMLKHLEQSTGDQAYVRSLRDDFLACYFAETDCKLATRVPLHMALIHLKRACKRFRWKDEPGWQDTIRHQIAEGVACLEVMEPKPPLQGVSDVTRIYDCCPAMP
jgi:aminoglycoside phosphotransferase (APT) family kinase protein